MRTTLAIFATSALLTPSLFASTLVAAATAPVIAPVIAPRTAPAPALRVQDDDTLQPVAMRADLAIKSVTVYRGRAAITREGSPELAQGLYELRVGPLPMSADLDSVQAQLGGDAKLLDVKTETVMLPAPSSDNPRVLEALKRVEAARANLTDITRRTANNASMQATINSIAAKVASDASRDMGTTLDPEKLRGQLVFLESERERLTAAAQVLAKDQKDAQGELAASEQALADAGGAPPAERFALVSIAVPRDGAIPISVTYLVNNASWQPSYTVRGNPADSALTLEFDAIVRQASGEDWTDVALMLSTAQPTNAANPRAVDPAYIDLYEPAPLPVTAAPAMRSRSEMVAPSAPAAAYDAPASMPMEASGAYAKHAARIDALGADAQVGGEGSAVEYRLPRTFTAASDASAERKTRVANIDAEPTFTLVAQPLVDADVYLRARFRNESGYLLLPGAARMYLGADSIGRASIAETSVGAEVELWFGKEPRVTAKREMLTKVNSESGVFSKAKTIDRSYRIELLNTLPRAVEVEVWDRVPVSRNAQAKMDLKDLAPALAADDKYTKDAKPQGLLKWTLSIPARAEGADAKPVALTWKTKLSWPEGMILSGDAD